jgi:transcriptional regulator with XRE-family HTH domain
MATVGERIRDVRVKRDWTQEKLAEKAGVSKSFLSEVENKGKNISLELLLKIATALGASLGYLASGEEIQQQERKPVMIPAELAEAAQELELSFPETLDLMEAYGALIARRSSRHTGTMSVADWKGLHEALKDVVKKVYG